MMNMKHGKQVRGEQHLYVVDRVGLLDLSMSRFRVHDLMKWADIAIRKGRI